MKKSEWSDKRITDILSEMPKIQDHRHPNDIYQNISSKVARRRRRTWIMPGIAAAAAILLVLILSPGLLKGQFSSNEQNANKMADKTEKVQYNGQEMKKSLNSNGISASQQELFTADTFIKRTALYENEVGTRKVLTYWIPDKQGQNLVPVSKTVMQDPNKTWIELFNDHMTDLKEDQWGLSEYYPLQATLKIDQNENSVYADVQTDNPYLQGTNSIIFQKMLQNVVQSNSDSKKIRLTTNGNPGILFTDFGEMRELPFKQLKDRAYFFYYADREEIPYLVPSNESYKDLNEALQAMSQDLPTEQLKASLGNGFRNAKAEIDKNNTLLVKMDPHAQMEDNASTLYSFEALLLTAKEFGAQKVKLENAPISKLGSFDLTKENKVPVGANYRP